ncbi:hypothetical protein EJ065_0040 [Corallococcus coralloides]|uniref:Uncharacterized protein n=1 Tax=Corallococcus coralloides TaxID=184914 RepID=A0A410RIH3_CORCK|nr:hypothetical protein EJ065_0040 [Corallococcus coralloides]
MARVRWRGPCLGRGKAGSWLSWDGLKFVQMKERSIIGEYWDMRTEAMQTFEVDLATGAQKGGVEE